MLTNDTSFAPPLDAGDPDVPATTRRHARRRFDRSTASVAVLLMLAGAGLYYMHHVTRDGVEMLANAESDASSLDTMLAGGQSGLETLARSLRATHEVVDRFSQRRDTRLASAALTGTPAGQDPFVFATVEATGAPPPAEMNNATRDLARAKSLAAAQRLHVQSILVGSSRRSCLINGKLYFEGQACGEFTIGQILRDGVSLQSGEFKFDLRLRK